MTVSDVDIQDKEVSSILRCQKFLSASRRDECFLLGDAVGGVLRTCSQMFQIATQFAVFRLCKRLDCLSYSDVFLKLYFII